MADSARGKSLKQTQFAPFGPGLPVFWSLKYKEGGKWWGHAYWGSRKKPKPGSCSMSPLPIWDYYINDNGWFDAPLLWEFVSEFLRVYYHEILHLIFRYRIGKYQNSEKKINYVSYAFSEWSERNDPFYNFLWFLFNEEMKVWPNVAKPKTQQQQQ